LIVRLFLIAPSGAQSAIDYWPLLFIMFATNIF
jgi:hypothetical protein